VQLKVERVLSPLRIGILFVTGIAWATSVHPPSAAPVMARVVLIAAAAYALADVLLIYRFPRIVARRAWASSVLDVAFVVTWLYATGGPHTQFLPLAVLGAASAPLRNAPGFALAITSVYGAAVVAIAGLGAWFDALYVLALGWGLTVWTAVTYRERRASLRDDLTGSFSREYANFRLSDVYEQDAFPLALAIIDLDKFKSVNDTYGHPAGDAVLVQTVRAITAAIRQGDLLARSGGDEFMLILPRTGADSARAIAERVRSGIELTRFRHRRDMPPVRLTVSIGVAVAQDARTDRTDLIKSADDLLYVAKENGRNRVAM